MFKTLKTAAEMTAKLAWTLFLAKTAGSAAFILTACVLGAFAVPAAVGVPACMAASIAAWVYVMTR